MNSVHPGIIDTPMADEFDAVGDRDAVDRGIPVGREARPDEVTPVVLFLASDESSYCTGGEYAVDRRDIGVTVTAANQRRPSGPPSRCARSMLPAPTPSAAAYDA